MIHSEFGNDKKNLHMHELKYFFFLIFEPQKKKKKKRYTWLTAIQGCGKTPPKKVDKLWVVYSSEYVCIKINQLNWYTLAKLDYTCTDLNAEDWKKMR